MVCVVVYTGKDSKIILNQGHYSYKISSLEKQMNRIFAVQIMLVIALCATFTLINFGKLNKDPNLPQYNIEESNYKSVAAFSLMSFFLMLMRLVPLDLIINTEVGKIVVSKLIQADAKMIKIDDNNGDLIACRV